jgi:hypothetical protein
MAAGDFSRTWFSEMVETLRQEWKPEMPWNQVIALRDRLDAMLQEIRFSRGIRPPTMWCPACNQRTQQAPPSVSVRALIFALGRFCIVPPVEAKSLEKRWAKHRKQNSLDRNGKLSQAATDSSREGPEAQSHSPTSKTVVDLVPEQEVQQAESLNRGPTRHANGH